MASLTDKERKARLDAETGTIRKAWQGHLRVALVYPNHYAVGMASLGFQTVYRRLNALPHVLCERAFLPESEDPGAPLGLPGVGTAAGRVRLRWLSPSPLKTTMRMY